MHIQAAPMPEGQQIDFYRRVNRWLRKNLSNYVFSSTQGGTLARGESLFVCHNPGIYVNILRDRARNICIDIFVGTWPLQQGVVRFRYFITNLKDLADVRKEYIAWRDSPRLLPFRQPQDVAQPVRNDPTLVLVDNLLRDLEWLLITRPER